MKRTRTSESPTTRPPRARLGSACALASAFTRASTRAPALASRLLRLSLVLAPLPSASLTVATSAAAQAKQADNKAEAHQHFERGVELAKRSAYGESLLEFSRAYELSPHYSVLYNIGQAHVALGHASQAVDVLKRYLSEGGANVALERRKEVEAQIVQQFARTALLEVRVDSENAQVTIDGEARGRTPLPGPVRLDLGTHQISVALDSGEHREQTVSVTAEANQVVDFQLKSVPAASLGAAASLTALNPPPAPAAPTPAAPLAPVPPADLGSSQDHGRSTLGSVIGAIGVGLGGGALVHFFWNRGRHSEWEKKYDHYFEQRTPENREEANQLAESIQRANMVTIGLTIGAGLALGTGTVLLLTDSEGKKPVGSLVGFRGVW